VTIYNAPELELVQNWKTQVSVMFGGDYNVLPGRLAVRAGVSYENDGIQPGSERLAFAPWSRMSIGLGLTGRLDRVEFSVAYQHVHWFARANTEAEANISQTTLTGGGIINAGRFTARADIVSLSASYRFAAPSP
jgi:long-subunit fatty acid transport protein